jgi:hypothetical protein
MFIVLPPAIRSLQINPMTHRIDPDIDAAGFSLIEDLDYSEQFVKTGWVKGSRCGNPCKAQV